MLLLQYEKIQNISVVYKIYYQKYTTFYISCRVTNKNE